MQGTPPLTEQRRSAEPATQWSAGLGTSLRKAEILHQARHLEVAWELRRTPSCVWLIATLSATVKLGIRTVFCPTGLENVKLTEAADGEFAFKATGGLGDYEARGAFLSEDAAMLHLEATLTPHEPIRVTAAPRDLCVFDSKLNPYRGMGRLHTCQTGNSAGQAFFSALEGKGGTVFYFHNLSSLADYFNDAKAALEGCVAGQWPEAGFALPAGNEPLHPGKSYCIADSFIEVAPRPLEETESSLMFLNALARIYPLLPQPAAEFYDWPETAKKTLKALTGSDHCTRTVDKKLFIEAYVGSSYKPPEGMVQGALIVPLMEYSTWRARPLPLLEKLRHSPESFFDSRLRISLRWLPGVDFTKDECSEEEKRFRMDSWYLLHTLINIGRMGEMGWENARKVFLDSIPKLILIARHFKYDWPVFFDQRNLKVFKQETRPGEGGEQDAGGLYIHIMLEAYTLTHRQEYLDEAEKCAQKMDGLCFGILYQTNNTVMGAVALARLWRATGKTSYKDLSIVSMASTFSHLWLWYLGRDTLIYMALPPLHDAPYVAFYEEAEILAALQTYQEEMRDDLPESLALIMAEYQKHLLARGKFYFPPELPEEVVSKEPKEGTMNPRLWIPLEGLGAPGDKAGTVGQAVYAAAAPFILSARCWHRMAGIPFTLFCSYPIFDVEFSGGKRAGEVQFRIGGSEKLSCLVKILPSGTNALSWVFVAGGKPQRLARRKEDGSLTFETGGNAVASIKWKSEKEE